MLHPLPPVPGPLPQAVVCGGGAAPSSGVYSPLTQQQHYQLTAALERLLAAVGGPCRGGGMGWGAVCLPRPSDVISWSQRRAPPLASSGRGG